MVSVRGSWLQNREEGGLVMADAIGVWVDESDNRMEGDGEVTKKMACFLRNITVH